jgi:hypothetical protein
MATASLTDNPWPRLTPEEVRRPGLRDRHPGRDVGVEEPVEMQPDPQPVRGRDGAVVRDLISHLMHEAGEPVTRRSRHSAQCGGIDPAGRRRRLATQETQEVGVVDSVDGDRRSRPVAAFWNWASDAPGGAGCRWTLGSILCKSVRTAALPAARCSVVTCLRERGAATGTRPGVEWDAAASTS